ncbi:MAG: GFA family protein [Cellvibrio sp.]|uniref:GFA family protein n=1 Tax=Cellvibrio sp. TaxID=1965322 RepID=UPI0031ACA486
MNYHGSCHCGNIKFEVEGNIDSALSCNCSICQRKGTLLSFFPADQFTLLGSGENVGDYTFNKHVIHHKFCKICGVSPYAEGTDPKGNRTIALNIRCIENIELEKIPVNHFNGRDH